MPYAQASCARRPPTCQPPPRGTTGDFLESKGLADATQVLLYLAVAKLDEPPIDGITDTNPEGLTAAKGKWSAAFAARLHSGGLKCRLLEGDEYTKAMLEKHVRICSPSPSPSPSPQPQRQPEPEP